MLQAHYSVLYNAQYNPGKTLSNTNIISQYQLDPSSDAISSQL